MTVTKDAPVDTRMRVYAGGNNIPAAADLKCLST